MFKFKQFTILQDKCAMKVGTDSVLLGAYCDVAKAKQVLDVGTGTGILALMICQRNLTAKVTAIEIDHEATFQAIENIKNSPYNNRITVLHDNFFSYTVIDYKYDLIISNPPYFENTFSISNSKRSIARGGESFTSYLFFKKCISLLNEDGLITIIIPYNLSNSWIESGYKFGLKLYSALTVYSKPNLPKRSILTFGFSSETVYQDSLTIMINNKYSEKYKELTKEFYLY